MYKIIVADDEPIIREGIINIFPWAQLGFEIVADFSDGKSTLEYIQAGNPADVVLTDIQMPLINGIELSEKLTGSKVKVVFFSSYQEFEYAKSAIKNDVYDYLIKPIKYEELYTCFQRLREKLDGEHSILAAAGMGIDKDTQHGAIIQTVISYLEDNFCDASLEEASQQVYMTPSYLSRLFKERVGINFSEYLLKIKMKHACELLCDSRYKLYEIAGRIGYDNPKNFTRAFKAYFHMTPLEYRNHHSQML